MSLARPGAATGSAAHGAAATAQPAPLPGAWADEPDRHEALNLQFTVNQSIRNSASVWIIVVFIAAAGYPAFGAMHVGAWVVIVGAAAALRSRLLRPAMQLDTVLANPPLWARRYAWLTIAMGAAIAIGPLTLFPAASDLLRMYLTLIFCTWAAGSLASVGGRPRVFGLYLGLFVVPVAVGWIASGSVYTIEVLLLLALFSAIMFNFARNFALQVRQGIDIRLQNDALVARLDHARIAAEEANMAKSRFLAVATHDLRQPLHALTLMNGMLMRARSPEQVAEITRQIGRALGTLERLFTSLLEHSRLETGGTTPNPAWFSGAQLLDRLAGEFRPRAQEKGLRLSIGACEWAIHSDAQLFERMLRNLLDNAHKFTIAGAVSVTTRLEEAGLVFAVADTGPGIAANMHEEVFKEYVQGEGAQRNEGLGLGLAIVRRLADLLGLTVQVTDNPGGGAIFEVRVPAAQVRRDHDLEAEQDPEEDEIDLRGLRVVYIDDDPHARDATRLLLEDWGCVALVAGDIDQALAASLGSEPDVVISDYSLGGGDTGLAVIGRFRERHGEVAGALVTGSVAPETLALFETIEYPVLFKPVNAAELRRLLEVFKSID